MKRPDAREAIGSTLIAGAALAGTFSDLFPLWLESFLNGAVLGFFLALYVFLWSLWRKDPAFRQRIVTVRERRVE